MTIQLYSLATPNGQKVSVALEEMGLAYEPHTIDITKDDQFSDDFVAINPNSKIPAIVDPDGPDGEPHAVFESGAILLYLAEKSGKLLPLDPALRSETLQWLFFQMGGVGPMFGQFGHFYRYSKDVCDHPYPTERYTKETKRLLQVLENRLQSREWVVSDKLTIADCATAPWIVCLDKFYQASDHLGLADYPQVNAWVERFLERPAVQKGMGVCAFPG